ncbi:MAG: 2-oxo acid dehydrogenase subunit E2, partial [Prolixibacteraceae bacterium]|nr:2-oxo acid dehydrogenase subunit E2 [Prolixibacteraceae bacterium]
MAVPVIMPRQGQSVETCIIGEWSKKVGDPIKKGDVFFSYETDKSSFEEEAKVDGEVLAIFYEEGDEVPVLTNVAVIGKKGENIEEFRPGNESAAPVAETASEPADVPVAAPAAMESENSTVLSASSVNNDGKSIASPRAKCEAEKDSICINDLVGTGPHGRIISRDVEGAIGTDKQMTKLAKAKSESEGLKPVSEPTGIGGRVAAADLTSNPVYGKSEDSEVKKLSHMRKLIGNAMFKSLHESAQLTHHMSADARKIMALRKVYKKKLADGETKENVTINDFICYAVIKALKKFPQANTHFLGDSIRYFNKIHLGLAVDTDRGLMVPVVKNADDLSLEGLAAQLGSVATQSRKGNINPDLLKADAASITVSNLGNYGVEVFTPILNLPQACILGVCTIVPRPKDLGGGVYGFVPM